MCSGVAWREDDDAEGGAFRGPSPGPGHVSRRPGSVLDLMCKTAARPSPRRRLQLFDRRELRVGRGGRAAMGRPLADYFAETIWGPAGMEADGHWARVRGRSGRAGLASARASATSAVSAN